MSEPRPTSPFDSDSIIGTQPVLSRSGSGIYQAPMPDPTTAVPKPPFIRLNVGGKKFMTTMMKGDNLLTKIIENDLTGAFPAVRDEEGNIFIDRNGRIFEVILDYLRTNSILLPGGMSPAHLTRELDFYCIPHAAVAGFRNIHEEFLGPVQEWTERVQRVLDRAGDRMKAMLANQVAGGSDSPTITLYRAGYGQISNEFALTVGDLANSLFRKIFCKEFKRRYGLDAAITQDSHLNVNVYLLICSLEPLFYASKWEASLERLAGTVYASASGYSMRSNR